MGERVTKAAVCVNLLSQILQNLSDGVLFISSEGKVEWASGSAKKMLRVAEIEGKRFWDSFPDDFFGFSMHESLKFGISCRLLYKSWEDKELEISSTFIFEGTGGLLLFCRDITELKRLQQERSRSEKIKELGTLTASVAHELRNPLGGIRGFAMLLQQDLEDQPYLQEMATSIIEGTKGMDRLVNRLLHYARPIEMRFCSVELGLYLRQFGRFLRVDPAFPKEVKLMLHIPADPVLVPIDAELLKSALLNLSFNAFQAMPEGGTLTIALSKTEASCLITLSDTGIGMSEEQTELLFTPFFTTKQKGNGLGLVETKKIVEGHGGTIEVRSQLQKGTSFVITLPLRRTL